MILQAALASLLLLAATALHAAAPGFEHLYPVALQRGTTNTVAAIGKFEPWPPKVWVDAPGIEFTASTNTGSFTISIAANAAPGPHLVRLHNGEGASGPRFLIVTTEPQAAEREPNDDFKKPQLLENFPITLNGRLDKSGDVDCFGIHLEAGQTLTASVESYTLASPVDAVLRLVDARGVQLAWNHDDGRTLDPFLAWTAPAAGTYVLQLFGFIYPANSDVRFTGGNSSVYRLHLSRGPRLSHTEPLGAQQGTKTKLRLHGWNLGSREGTEYEFDGARLPVSARETVLQIPGIENTLPLPLGSGPELVEQEPNGTAATANSIAIPSAITGRIGKPGDEDRFRFQAKKNQILQIDLSSASVGFPLDAWLRIEDANGKELTRSDDGVTSDPALEWTAPADGAYVVAVGSVLQRGGSDYLYRLGLQVAEPSVRLTVADHSFTIEPGKTNEIKVAIKRLHGFTAKLSVAARGLPAEVSAARVEIGEKENEIVFKVVAGTAAKATAGVFEILATESVSGTEHPVLHELITSTVNNGVPNGFNHLAIESTPALWLTVIPPDTKKAPEKKPGE